MGALPKQRITRHRQGNRRRHLFIPALNLVNCPNCGDYRRPHHVCMTCGTYRGRQVIQIEERRREAE